MRIPELLREWRHSQRMTIEQMANSIGLTWDTYRRVEQGGPMNATTFTRIMGWICGSAD